MSILLVKTKIPYKRVIKDELNKNPTADDVLCHLFGDGDGYINSRYTIREYESAKSNAIQRINVLWFIPIYAVFIAPVRWIITGSTGLKTESKSYKIAKWLIGNI